MTTPVSPFSFFQGVDLSRTGQSVAPSLLPSVQAYANSGLARFGIGNGYRPAPYVPQNFMAPGLAAMRVRAQEPVTPITDPIADSGGGGPGTGPGNGPGGGTPDGPGGISNGIGPTPTLGQIADVGFAFAAPSIPTITRAAKSLFDMFNGPDGLSPLDGMVQGLQADPTQGQNDADPGPAGIGANAAAANAAAANAAAAAADAAANIGIDADAAAAAAAADGSDGSGNGDSASADGGGDYAKGGRPPVGKVSVVGEEGPELFVPDKPGTILPHHIYMQLLKHTMSGRR